MMFSINKKSTFRISLRELFLVVLFMAALISWRVDRTSLVKELDLASLNSASAEVRRKGVMQTKRKNMTYLLYALGDPAQSVVEAADSKLRELTNTKGFGDLSSYPSKEKRFHLISNWVRLLESIEQSQPPS